MMICPKVILVHRPEVSHHQFIEYLHLIEKLLKLLLPFLPAKSTKLFDILIPQSKKLRLKFAIRLDE